MTAPEPTLDDLITVADQSGLLDHLDINPGDVRDGHHRIVVPAAAIRAAYALGHQRGYAQAKADATVMYGQDGTAHQPVRGSDIDTWIKAARDVIHPKAGLGDQGAWWALDDLLNDYRLRADTGATLTADPADLGPNPDKD